MVVNDFVKVIESAMYKGLSRSSLALLTNILQPKSFAPSIRKLPTSSDKTNWLVFQNPDFAYLDSV